MLVFAAVKSSSTVTFIWNVLYPCFSLKTISVGLNDIASNNLRAMLNMSV